MRQSKADYLRNIRVAKLEKFEQQITRATTLNDLFAVQANIQADREVRDHMPLKMALTGAFKAMGLLR